MEAEIKAARERAIVPLEARMKQFKDMLLERGVRNLCVCEEGDREGQILPLINEWSWYKTPSFKEIQNCRKVLISVLLK